jgi:RHS repeat-associated protein
VGLQAAMSYTALNQLYFAATPTSSPGTWDFAWHWYDPQGLRVMSWVASGNSIVTPRPDSTWTLRNYYVYDGSDVALTLVKSGSTWRIQQRYVMGGVDEPLATRVWTGDATLQESLVLVPDRQGTSVTAIKGNGDEECRVAYASHGAFGALDGVTTPCGNAINVATGYTGASVPTGAGGYTYLRNRWYDPQTGRFLTQDPIGLAGGANLYAYAGKNPISFDDPYGLCPWCIGAALGVVEGYALAKVLGQQYTWKDAAVDATTGAIGGGLVGKLGQLAKAAKRVALGAEAITEGVEAAEHVATSELRATHRVSRRAVARLQADIEENGIQEPLKYVEHQGEKHVVDGNHRLRAARNLGIKEVPAEKVELPYKGYKTAGDLTYSR